MAENQSTNDENTKPHIIIKSMCITSVPFVLAADFVAGAVGDMFNGILKIFGDNMGTLFGGGASFLLVLVMFGAAPIVIVIELFENEYSIMPILLNIVISVPLSVWIWVCAMRGVILGVNAALNGHTYRKMLKDSMATPFLTKEQLQILYAMVGAVVAIGLAGAFVAAMGG